MPLVGVSPGTVSYTHLDVYKRQIAWWAIGGIGWLAYQEGPWSARFLTATLAVTVAVAAWHAWIDAFGTVTFRAKDAPSPAV